MKTLEEQIHDLARRGELTHLSLTPRGNTFVASFAPARAMGVFYGEDADPVKAIRAALACTRKPAPSKDEMDFG